MRRRLCVRLPDDLAQGIDALAQHSGKTKSEVVRETLANAGLGARGDTRDLAEVLKRAAALRARQPKFVDAAALVREVRSGSALRLELRRLNIPIMQGDLA